MRWAGLVTSPEKTSASISSTSTAKPPMHGLVVIDDAVGDRVEDGARADAEQVRMRLEIQPDVVQRAGGAMTDRDHELRAHEHHDLADLHELVAVDVARGLQHEEQRLSVHLQLGALMRVDGVLDSQRVQVEVLGDSGDDLG